MVAFALLGLLLVGLTTYRVVSKFDQMLAQGTDVLTVLQPSADEADQLLTSLADGELGVRGFVISGKKAQLVRYRNAIAKGDASIERLDEVIPVDEPELIRMRDNAVRTRDEWMASNGPVIKSERQGLEQRSNKLLSIRNEKRTYLIAQSASTALREAIDTRLIASNNSLGDAVNSLRLSLTLATGIALAGIGFALWAVFSSVLKPLRSLTAQLREVTGQGHHHAPIKPSGPPELLSAGRDAEDMRRRLVLEIDEARAAREGLEQEGPVVSAIEEQLRTVVVPDATGFEVYGTIQPAEGVLAGDWWDVRELPDGSLAVIVTDVSGHGPEAGIVGLRTKDVVTSLLMRGVDCAEALTSAAQGFASMPARFATVAVVVIRPDGELVWANAGHHPPLIQRAAGGWAALDPTGPLLSALGGTWTSGHESLAAGDTLLMWTDGLLESHDAQGSELGESAAKELVMSAADASVEELVTQVLAQARQRATDWKRDDVTMVAVRRT